MIISEITEVSKSKVKIVLDNEFAFCLYKGELRAYKLNVGQEFTDEMYSEIIDKVLLKRAKLRAMHLLEKRDYTEHKLREKLMDGEYPEDIIDKALAYVISYGYVDDVRYAKSYIEYAKNTKSKKQIEMDLFRKGISKDDMETAFDDSEFNADSEEELIRGLLVKKHYNFEESDYENKKKMIGYLYRKGFTLDKIYKVMGEKTDFFDNYR